MTNLLDLLKQDANFNLTIQKTDLIDFAKLIIEQTKAELEAVVIADKGEKYLTRLETCDFLRVDQSTLFRWAKRGYLTPIEVGGKRVYKMSDLKTILNGGIK